MHKFFQKAFLLGLVTVEVCVIAGFWIWTRESRGELAAQGERNVELKEQQQVLQHTIDTQKAYQTALTSDKKFLEQVAREKLEYAASDEWVFIIEEEVPNFFE